MRRHLLAAALLGIVACGKGDPPPGNDQLQQHALLGVKAYITQNLDDLRAAAVDLQSDAPAPDADGWNATADAAAVDKLKADWKRARTSYEHIEGAIAVLFPDLDISTDDRYDGFIAANGPDTDLFDDQNVTGIHAIERIVWSDQIPQRVLDFESRLPGYQAARFPQNQAEADAFKNKLCARLITDIDSMRSQFGPLALDPSAAYRGVIGSMREQVEKAEKAASGEEESRYAQYTLADMRTNVQAGLDIYGYFRPWLEGQAGGSALDRQILAAYQNLLDAYAANPGDSLPPVPNDWSSQNPTATDLASPFGKLWQAVKNASDPNQAGSLVADLESSAGKLGIPPLP